MFHELPVLVACAPLVMGAERYPFVAAICIFEATYMDASDGSH